jgi:uncharacterized protein YceH (UPF0502 family)
MLLSPVEVRVLGSLLEKKYATPEYYPMSINSLTAACNQKSSREPVTDYSEQTVEACVENLNDKRLVTRVSGAGMKVVKYKEYLCDRLSLTQEEAAVLTVLMLRGEQTVGEIRTRCERIYPFADFDEADAVIEKMMNREDPLVTQVPGTHGRSRKFIHLFYGNPEVSSKGEAVEVSFRTPLEEEVETLKAEVEYLKSEIAAIKKELGLS